MTDQADPTFVNTLKIHGFLNGVINLGFSAAKWYVNEEGQIAVNEPIIADLRMDLATAQAVHAALGQHIEANTKPTGLAN